MRYSRNRRVWYHCRSGKEPGDGFRRDAGNEPQKRKKPQNGGFVILEELFVVALLSLTGRGVSTPRFAALQATASARSRHDSAPDDQKAQWNTTAAPLPSSSKQAATTGSRPRGGCLLPFPACAGHGQKARSAQSGTAWPTRMRVDRGSRPTVQIGQHGGIAAKGS